MDNKKNYNKMEDVLQKINRSFVTVSSQDSKEANPVLNFVVQEMKKKMKEVNPLFNYLFEKELYCGSYYDNLKVGKPEEFDLDFTLVLPKCITTKVELSTQPGFVKLHTTGWETLETQDSSIYKELIKFKDPKGYLSRVEMVKWMESTVTTALNKFPKISNQRYEFNNNGKIYHILVSKSGPAMTMKIQCASNKLYMDVDLVPVIKLSAKHWPPSPFRPLPSNCTKKSDFLLVPKAPHDSNEKSDNFWRLSFQEQERILINDIQAGKPALRLLKKLRDTRSQRKICSYFIKSVLLDEIDKRQNDSKFWQESLSNVFMHMLKTLRDHLENHNISYFWYKKFNLLSNIEKETINNFKNFLNRMIATIDREVDNNPIIVAQFILTQHELENFLHVDIVETPENITNNDNRSYCILQ